MKQLKTVTLFVIIFGFSCSERPHVDPQITKWIKDNAVPFDTAEPGGGYDDLMPLKKMVGDARVVALGESTHGTHEFFTMKHRMLEFLVKEMGFNVFAIEASWPDAEKINDYVHTGKGNPKELLAGLLFWTCNTQETLDIIEWIRKYNETSSSKVNFTGFDMQFTTTAIKNVKNYLRKIDSNSVFIIDSLYKSFRSFDGKSNTYTLLSDSSKLKVYENTKAVYNYLIAKKIKYVHLSSIEQFETVLQNAQIVIEAENHVSHRNKSLSRDRYMAENIKWILENEGNKTKIILSAHNEHVGVKNDSILNSKNMGGYLRDFYGQSMIVFGLTHYKGSFNAISLDTSVTKKRRMAVHNMVEEYENSYELSFRNTDIKNFFLDVRDPGFISLFHEPMYLSRIGSGYDTKYKNIFRYKTNLRSEFDVIIYFQETTPSLLL